jgi:hypothetical protein
MASAKIIDGNARPGVAVMSHHFLEALIVATQFSEFKNDAFWRDAEAFQAGEAAYRLQATVCLT